VRRKLCSGAGRNSGAFDVTNKRFEETTMIREKVPAIVLALLALGIGACEKKGPVEKAGEKLDHVVDTVKNGGEETTGDKIQDSVDKVRDKAADATDKVEGK
jgi:hypothetical protein